MRKPSDAAVHVEAVKTALRQSKDGVVLSLALHPNDMPPSILTDPVGTRYMVALVRLGDDDQPETPREKTDGERAVVSAGLLCKLPEFWRWLQAVKLSKVRVDDEEQAAHLVRGYCGITSRRDLAFDREAREKFFVLRSNFEDDTK